MSVRQQVSNHLAPNRNSIGIDQYDHAINLVDTTIVTSPTNESSDQDPVQESSKQSDARKISVEDAVPVSRILSKTTLNQEFNRRRYARFQEDKYNDDSKSESTKPAGKARAVIESLDNKRGRALERLHLRAKKAVKTKDVRSAVDILYENQRGLFFFGYPLYSSRSLLNFDPSAWTNAQIEDSAVDIRSAQVPDPTWVWSWKRWYVDMSGDVDEQGWQYSLMFGKNFSWHGNHPWFHSNVRRRRWLRQRTKIEHAHNITDGHDLAQDYFTIHPNTARAGNEPSITSKGVDRSSKFGSRFAVAQESEDEEEEIDNVVSLLHALKITTVDRKKVDAFRNFLKHGESELQLLPQVLPEIWNLFLYQKSACQLLELLEEAEHEASPASESTSEDKQARHEALQSSIQYIREHLSRVEYYSDAKALEKELDDHDAGHMRDPEIEKSSGKGVILDNVKPSKEPSEDINIETSRVSFQGIPRSAELNVSPGIARPITKSND